MANGEEGKTKGKDYYEVLGLDKGCSASELRNAYKKLALRWHPDRCSASGNSKFVEEAKKKFQAVQQAYSVLSDDSRRFLYDAGLYDSDDDDSGMGDFLNEMAVMMSQTKPSENGEENFEQLQELFEEMFQGDIDSLGTSYHATSSSCSTSSSCFSFSESSNSSNLHTSMSSGLNRRNLGFDSHFQKFCLGTGGTSSKFQVGEGSRKKNSSSCRR